MQPTRLFDVCHAESENESTCGSKYIGRNNLQMIYRHALSVAPDSCAVTVTGRQRLAPPEKGSRISLGAAQRVLRSWSEWESQAGRAMRIEMPYHAFALGAYRPLGPLIHHRIWRQTGQQLRYPWASLIP